MTSPTVSFVLEDLIARNKPQPGEYGVMLAFGVELVVDVDSAWQRLSHSIAAGERVPSWETWDRICKLSGWPQTFVSVL